ncbi:hypothetical protein QBC35DRAFT_418934 [Podospora australis]|uniref:Uncharacterized protein n=1 Tax=Podospora australis TaxID=1536484 RepID=A0AAN7ADQ6_9PEZI|nr:hypothetical protein QBC35DRAFT_418934 [Podospora australis]
MAPTSGFPTTVPAFKIKAQLSGLLPVGDIHTGSNLTAVTFGGGSLKSVEGFTPKLDAKIVNGHDWFRVDNDKKHGRLSISGIATDDEGRSLRVIAEGLIELNEHTAPVLFGGPDAAGAADMPFGFAVEYVKFEVGHEAYKALDNALFAGSLRFGKSAEGLYAEIAVAKIVAGSGFE